VSYEISRADFLDPYFDMYRTILLYMKSTTSVVTPNGKKNIKKVKPHAYVQRQVYRYVPLYSKRKIDQNMEKQKGWRKTKEGCTNPTTTEEGLQPILLGSPCLARGFLFCATEEGMQNLIGKSGIGKIENGERETKNIRNHAILMTAMMKFSVV